MSISKRKFIGKIVKGFDPDGRGRYKVHLPEILPYMPETEGIFCMNEINGSRISGSSRGMTGSYKPLYEGQRVAVEFTTEDINSGRIVEVVGDEDLAMTPSIKKICCGETGKIEKERDLSKVKGRANLSIKLDIDQIIKQFDELQKTAIAKFGQLVDFVNQLNIKKYREWALSKLNSSDKEKENSGKSLLRSNSDDSFKKTSYESYFKEQFGRDPTKEENELMEIAGGIKTADKYVVEKKQDWEKTEPESINNNSQDGSRDLDNTSKEEGIPTAQENQEDRDEETIVAMTPNKTAIAITEKSSSNPDAILIIHKGKQTAIKINDDGIYLSTDLNSFSRICINRDIQIDGTSSITVNGGNYDIYVNGKVNLHSTNDINLSTDTNINIKATSNINIEAGENINILSQSLINETKDSTSFKSGGDYSIKSDGKLMLDSQELQCRGESKASVVSSGYVAADGSKVLLNSGASVAPSTPDISVTSVPAAEPSKRSVCKL